LMLNKTLLTSLFNDLIIVFLIWFTVLLVI
jgi:hypothetical protein